jgi:hypothetical protein
MILLALLLQATSAPARLPGMPVAPTGPGQPPATMVFEPVAMAIAGFDADGDGKTTAAELDAGVARTYAAIDTGRTDRLGFIAYADWAERWLGDRHALPSPFEVDGDGDDKISRTELQTQFARTAVRFDRDKDKVLTRAELLTIRAVAGGERPRKGR